MSYTTTARDSRPSWEVRPYSPGQNELIKNMMAERSITPAMLLKVFPTRPATFADGRKVIEWLKGQAKAVSGTPSQPSAPQAPNTWEDITDGNYALPYNGKTHFYRVSRKAGKGKYEGRTFVNVQERASDMLFRIDNRARQVAILHSIREYGAEASHLLFAEVMDSCWHCFKDIGDETNPYKPHGLGPVCGPKVMGSL
jgi:hypothetical protein